MIKTFLLKTFFFYIGNEVLSILYIISLYFHTIHAIQIFSTNIFYFVTTVNAGKMMNYCFVKIDHVFQPRFGATIFAYTFVILFIKIRCSTTDAELRWRVFSCLLRLFLTERFFSRPRIERGFPCFHGYAWQYKIFWCLHWYQKTIIPLCNKNTLLWNKKCTEDNSEEIDFWKQYNYIHDNNRTSLLVIGINF